MCVIQTTFPLHRYSHVYTLSPAHHPHGRAHSKESCTIYHHTHTHEHVRTHPRYMRPPTLRHSNVSPTTHLDSGWNGYSDSHPHSTCTQTYERTRPSTSTMSYADDAGVAFNHLRASRHIYSYVRLQWVLVPYSP